MLDQDTALEGLIFRQLKQQLNRWQDAADTTNLYTWLQRAPEREDIADDISSLLREVGALRFDATGGQSRLDAPVARYVQRNTPPPSRAVVDVGAKAEADEEAPGDPTIDDADEVRTPGVAEGPEAANLDAETQREHAGIPCREVVEILALSDAHGVTPRPRRATGSHSVTPQRIEAFKRAFTAGGLRGEPAVALNDEPVRLRAFQHACAQLHEVTGDPCPSGVSRHALQHELERLEASFDAQALSWKHLRTSQRHALYSYFVARCLHLQELAHHTSRSGKVLERIDRLIPRVNRERAEANCGFVHGLMRDAQPKYGHHWIDDVRHWASEVFASAPETDESENHTELLRSLTEDINEALAAPRIVERIRAILKAGVSPKHTRLINLARPYYDSLEGADFRDLRKEIASEAPESPSDDDDNPLSDDWMGYAYTRGKHAALIGGDVREDRRKAIEARFGFASLEWIPSDPKGPRRLQALTRRMENGNVDVVITLRAFCSHMITDAVFAARKNAPDCFVVLSDNYGLTQLQLGIERFAGRGRTF